jgi:hypothetical protein
MMSLSGGRSCRCEGSNANCAWCFGTGVVSPADAAGGLTPVGPRADGPSFIIPTQEPAKPRGVFRQGRRPGARRLVSCPRCAVQVRSDRLEAHVRNVHPAESARPQRVRHSSAPRMTRCPQCAAQVRTDRLEAHVRKVHRTTEAARPRVHQSPTHQHGVRRQGSATLGEFFPSDSDGGRTERQLDSCRDYRGFRERGRFGSHPSHDDYSDESKA